MSEKCSICGVVEVFSTDPDRDYCLTCWMSGDYFDQMLCSDERSNMLQRIRQLPNVVTARVFHAGDSAFQLAIVLTDGRMVMPGLGGNINGQQLVMPFVPPADQGWGVLVRRPVEADNEWAATTSPLPEKYDDDELVELVAGLDVALP